MRYLLFILAFLCGFKGLAQGPVYIGQSTDKVINKGYMGSAKGIINAIRDTGDVPMAERINGLLIISSDSSLFVWKASSSRWLSVSGAGALKAIDSNLNGGYASYKYVFDQFRAILEDSTLHVNQLGWALIRVDSILNVDSTKLQTTYAGSLKADKATTLTINGTTQTLAANRTWSVGTVTSITAGTGLTGGTVTGSGTFALPSVGTAGTYGGSTAVPIITTDAQGRVSAVTTTTISGSTGTIWTFVESTANGNYTVPGVNYFVTLSSLSITTQRTVTLPAGVAGATVIIVNYNTSGQSWVTSPSYRNASGSTVSALANQTLYRLVYDGNISAWRVW